MFDMGFQELLLIGVIALLVMGPERLPGAVRTATLWISRMRRSFQQIKSEIEQEIDADALKRDFHNQSIMKSLQKTTDDISSGLQGTADSLTPDLDKLEYDIRDVIETTTPASSATDDSEQPAAAEPDDQASRKS
jgi:sec-independent protein translocase protein TatB